MKNRIYLIGKVKDTSIENRIGGWRNKLIKDLFDVNIEMGLDASDEIDIKNLILPINDNWEYVGPYLLGCDHSCSHNNIYAHGINNCTSKDYFVDRDEDNIPIPNKNVFRACVKQINCADLIVVNFDENPLESYGSLAEIGYAYGLNKPIISIGCKHVELWFAESMTNHMSFSELKNHIISIGNTSLRTHDGNLTPIETSIENLEKYMSPDSPKFPIMYDGFLYEKEDCDEEFLNLYDGKYMINGMGGIYLSDDLYIYPDGSTASDW